MLLIALLLYFLPVLIASVRNHPNHWSIFWTNFLFGWTFIGWGVALVWAFSAIPEGARLPRRTPW